MVNDLHARRPNAVPGGGGGDGITMRHQAWPDQRSDPAPGLVANTDAGAGGTQQVGDGTDGADMHPHDQLSARGPADPGSGDVGGSSSLAASNSEGDGEGRDAGRDGEGGDGGGEAKNGESGAVGDSIAAGDDSEGEELAKLWAQDTQQFAETLTELRAEGSQLLEELCVTSGAMEIDRCDHNTDTDHDQKTSTTT